MKTGAGTVFFQGNSNALTLTDLQTATATVSVPVVARGLVLKDSVSGDPVLVGASSAGGRNCNSRQRRILPAGGHRPPVFFEVIIIAP